MATPLLKVTFHGRRPLLVSALVRGGVESGQLQPAGAHGGDDATVDQKVTAGDESTVGTHQVGSGCADLVGRAATSCSGDLDHLR